MLLGGAQSDPGCSVDFTDITLRCLNNTKREPGDESFVLGGVEFVTEATTASLADAARSRFAWLLPAWICFVVLVRLWCYMSAAMNVRLMRLV